MEKQLKDLKKTAELLLAEMKDFKDSVHLLDNQLLNKIAPLPTTKRSRRKGLKKEVGRKNLEDKSSTTCLSGEASSTILESLQSEE